MAGTTRADHALFLIRSPFQAYLAARIIRQYAIERPLVLYISRENRAKGAHYFRELEPLAADSAFLRVERGPASAFSSLRTLTRILRWVAFRRIGHVYMANHFLWYFRVLTAWTGARVSTFDDGSGNYISIDNHRWSRGDPHRERLCRLLGGGDMTSLHARIEAHYAVRPDLPNVIDAPLKPIDLKGDSAPAQGDPLNLFIGQPMEEGYADAPIARYFDIVRARADLYFPHPREKRRPFPTVESDLIIEDFAARQDRPVRVWGPFSTAFITLQGVEKICIDLDGNPEYRALMEQAGCRVISLDEAATLP